MTDTPFLDKANDILARFKKWLEFERLVWKAGAKAGKDAADRTWE